MTLKSEYKKLAIWIIYFLILVSLVLIINYAFLLVINETKIADGSDFTALGAISNATTAIIGIFLLTLTLGYLLETRNMVQEMKKQRAIIEKPAVSLKAVPSTDAANIINLVLKNTGGGPAYDVTVEFDPDLPYDNKSLNELNMFRKMTVLDKGESVELFFASAPEYFKSDNPKRSTATIKYYTNPHHQNEIKPEIRITEIDIEERKDQLYVSQRGIDDLVDEIEELKQGLLIISSNIKRE